MGGIVAGSAGDAAAWMSSRAAHVQAAKGRAIVGMAQHRTGGEKLVQRQGTVENVAADKSESALQVEGRIDLPADDALRKARRIFVDCR